MKSSNENGYPVITPVPTVKDHFEHLASVFTDIEKTDVKVTNVVMTPGFWVSLKKAKHYKDSCDLGSSGGGHIGYVWGSKIWLSEVVAGGEVVAYGEDDPNFLKDWPAFANWGFNWGSNLKD